VAQVLAVGCGGFLGCSFRFGLTKLFDAFGQFPIATLMANVIAGFLIGFFTGAERGGRWMTPHVKLFLTTGMLGGLSTFSTFSLETIRLFAEERYLHAVGNIALNLALSFGGVVLGLAAARLLFGENAA